MARYRRGKKALYEVMSEARLKPGYGRTLKKMRPDKPGDDEPVTETEETTDTEEIGAVEESTAAETPDVSVRWWRKPRIVQFNAGRLEFSLPYQLAIAIVLGLVVVALVAFRAGQLSQMVSATKGYNPSEKMGENRGSADVRTSEGVRGEGTTVKKTGQDTGNVGAVTSTGNNVIVLVEHGVQTDLVPVQAHFAGYGIETEIVKLGNRYFLMTKDRYSNPDKPGTAGFIAKQKIVEVGAKYKGKAPEGFETFARHYFSDAYGRKVDW